MTITKPKEPTLYHSVINDIEWVKIGDVIYPAVTMIEFDKPFDSKEMYEFRVEVSLGGGLVVVLDNKLFQGVKSISTLNMRTLAAMTLSNRAAEWVKESI